VPRARAGYPWGDDRRPTDFERALDPGEQLSPEGSLAQDRALLLELEPEAGRLLDRHLAVAQEWFPHDFIPYRLGRDFDREPWTPDQPRLTGVAQTAFEVGLLTEDNLPSYHRLIHGMFGRGDGAWLTWVGRWTAEEGRHAIVLRDYLTVTRNIDPVLSSSVAGCASSSRATTTMRRTRCADSRT
jgi:hypothetical protein